MPRLNRQNNRGFTLLEVVVAMGIFTIVLTILLGVYSNFIFSQRRNIAQQKLLEEARFTLELISREVRTGYSSTFNHGKGPVVKADNHSGNLFLKNQNTDCVHYRHLKGAPSIQRGDLGQSASPQCEQAQLPPNTIYSDITGRDIIVDDIRFDIQADNKGNDPKPSKLKHQGIVTIILTAHHATNPNVPPITVQSSVASKQLAPYEKN